MIHPFEDANGNPTTYLSTIYSYDSNGQLSSITRPNGDVESYIYTKQEFPQKLGLNFANSL